MCKHFSTYCCVWPYTDEGCVDVIRAWLQSTPQPHTIHVICIQHIIQTVNQPHTLRAVWNILTGEFVRESVLVFVVFLFGISIADYIVWAHFIYYLQIHIHNTIPAP